LRAITVAGGEISGNFGDIENVKGRGRGERGGIYNGNKGRGRKKMGNGGILEVVKKIN
jgi:hypothetical protein